MNIDPGQPIDREPLTPEERELAQRLSRLGPSAGPPSSVDARILAAAHDAVASRPRPKPRSHRRWPVALGVAASLTLAVGIAWRMRPLPEAPQYAAESPASAEIVAEPSVAKGPAPPSGVYFQVQESKKIESEPAAPAETQSADKEQPKQESAPSPAEPAIVVDENRALDMQAPPPAAPPPPPAPAAAMSAPAADAAAAGAGSSAQERERMSEAADAASMQRAKSVAAPRAQANEAPESRREAQSLDTITIDADDAGDEPPAYANSPEVREAWLRRVRELIIEGNQQQALDSLHEFQRRYPDHPLPDDLQRFQQSKTNPVAP